MALPDDMGPTDIQAVEPSRQFGPRQMRKAVTITAIAGGVFLLIFDLGWIPGITNKNGTTGTLVIYAAAAYFLAMGAFAWFLFGRTISRRALRLTVSSNGLTAILGDQSSLKVAWSNPTFDGGVTDWTQAPTNPLAFQLRADGRQVWTRITRPGFVLLETEARRNNLSVETVTNGKPPRTWTVTRIRSPNSPSSRM